MKPFRDEWPGDDEQDCLPPIKPKTILGLPYPKMILAARISHIWSDCMIGSGWCDHAVSTSSFNDITYSYTKDAPAECRAVGDFPLDVPHVVLEYSEANIVTGPFLVSNTVYLISPNSLSFARAKIAKDEATDRRCASLYEACDYAYVNRKRASIASLRQKLGF